MSSNALVYFFLNYLFIQDVDDMNKLLKELRENQKLRKINVIFSPAVPKDNFPHPVSSEQLAKVLKGLIG